MARRGFGQHARDDALYAAPPPPPPPVIWTGRTPAPHPGHHAAPRVREAQWLCAVCNLLNWQSRPRCRECGTPANILNPTQVRPDSPPRRRRHRQEAAPTLPPWAAAPRLAPSAPALPAGSSAEPAPAARKLQALKDALEALKTADAPADMQAPLREEITKMEEEARQSQPLGQRLDHARAALRKAETKMEAAATASLAAREKLHGQADSEVPRWAGGGQSAGGSDARWGHGGERLRRWAGQGHGG